MANIEAEITNINLSLIQIGGNKLERFGSVALKLKCECGTKQDPLVVFKYGKTTEDYNCTNCGKEYQIEIPTEISLKVKEKASS